MSVLTARLLAGSLLGLYVGCLLATVGLVIWDSATVSQLLLIITIGYAVVGALVATREPGNAIGWLLLVAAVSLGLQEIGTASVVATEGPGEPVAAWLAVQSVWLYVGIVLLPLLYPTGRLPTPRWRSVLWLGVAGLVIAHLGILLDPSIDLDDSQQVANPIGVDSSLVEFARVLGEVVLFSCLVLSAVSVVMRLRRSHGRERQQLKLFAFVAGLAAVVLLLGLLTLLADSDAPMWVDVLSTVSWFSTLALVVLGLPIAIGVAILKHRLYGIDLVIKRTLVYAALTATLVATYLVLVLVLRTALNPLTGESDLAVAASTLTVAALFRPVRANIQTLVDRRFYRSRYDAAKTLERFSGRLRDELDLTTLGDDLRRVVSDTVQPAHVSLWLREAAR